MYLNRKRNYSSLDDLISRVQILYNSLENSEKTKLSVTIKNPDLEIFADQNLISQVLINLVKNALEANENNPDAVDQDHCRT